jgi:uncharacterized protein GlcG (DUF336 family)
MYANGQEVGIMKDDGCVMLTVDNTGGTAYSGVDVKMGYCF